MASGGGVPPIPPPPPPPLGETLLGIQESVSDSDLEKKTCEILEALWVKIKANKIEVRNRLKKKNRTNIVNRKVIMDILSNRNDFKNINKTDLEVPNSCKIYLFKIYLFQRYLEKRSMGQKIDIHILAWNGIIREVDCLRYLLIKPSIAWFYGNAPIFFFAFFYFYYVL